MDHTEHSVDDHENKGGHGFRVGDLVTRPDRPGVYRGARIERGARLHLLDRCCGESLIVAAHTCRLCPPVQIQAADLPIDIRFDGGVPGLSEEAFIERFESLLPSLDLSMLARLAYRVAVAKHDPDRVRRSCEHCGSALDARLTLRERDGKTILTTLFLPHVCPIPEPGFGAYVVDARDVGWMRTGRGAQPFENIDGERASWADLCASGPVDVRFDPETA